MTNIRLFAAIAVSVVVTALVMGAITRPAHADTPRTAECMTAGLNSAQIQKEAKAWMDQQLAAGRTNFVSIAPTGNLCAW